MSKCPNCGSAGRIRYDEVTRIESHSYECDSQIATDNPKNTQALILHQWVKPIQSRQCVLIRSLREELAERREICGWSSGGPKCCVLIKDHGGSMHVSNSQTMWPKALRSNEHRSNA